jgi:D-sedoheptulose 7-phosphate isomerase
MEHIRSYLVDLEYTIDQLPVELIDTVIQVLSLARMNKQRVFIMGNGGSASTASHFVCDLAKNTRKKDLPNFQVHGLTDNMALLSAYANDEGYENVFAEQLISLVQPGDVVIGISTSGDSPNVLKAIQAAKAAEAITIGFTGFDGGALGSMVDIHLHVHSTCIEHVEDVHLMLEHLICKALRDDPIHPKLQNQIHGRVADDSESLLRSQDHYSNNSLVKVNNNGQPRLRLPIDSLYALANDLQNEEKLENQLERILKVSIESVGAESGSLLVFDEQGEVSLGALAYDGRVRNEVSRQIGEIVRNGLAGWVAENRSPALISNTKDDPRWLQRSWEKRNGSRSAVSVPLINSNRVIGVLTVSHTKMERFTEEDLVLLGAIAVCVSFVSPNGLSQISQSFKEVLVDEKRF